MANDSTHPLIHPGAADRRPALWPWLVMPLVALALFCGLSRLRHTIYSDPGTGIESSLPAESENP